MEFLTRIYQENVSVHIAFVLSFSFLVYLALIALLIW